MSATDDIDIASIYTFLHHNFTASFSRAAQNQSKKFLNIPHHFQVCLFVPEKIMKEFVTCMREKGLKDWYIFYFIFPRYLMINLIINIFLACCGCWPWPSDSALSHLIRAMLKIFIRKPSE